MRNFKHVAAAIVLAATLAACSEDDPAAPDSLGDEGEQTSATATPAPDCPAVATHRESLEPGCWAIQARGLVDGPRAELELPAGFTGNDAWVWVNADPEDEWGAITLLPVGAVHPDPCARAEDPPEPAPSVEGFARALVAQRVTATTTPVPVSVGGHEGVYLELSVPAGFDSSACRGEELILWEPEGAEAAGAEPSFVSRYWVLDVDGRRVVLVVNTNSDAPDETVDLFTGIVESAALATG